jgi:hypothetical protein
VTHWNRLRQQGMPLPGDAHKDTAVGTQERSTSS